MMADRQLMDKILTNPLSGKLLRTAMGELPGSTIIFWNASGNGTNGYGGYLYEELRWLSLSLNFSVEMKPMRNAAFGSLVNGNWSGIRGQLQRQEIDFACSPYSGMGGTNIMDLAAYTRSDEHVLVTRYPTPISSIYGHITTFSPGVWLGVLLSMIVCVVFIKVLDVLKRQFVGDDDDEVNGGFSTLIDISEYIFATITNHGGYFKESHRSLGVMSATWCFATFVLVNAYCSCLTSYMSLIFQRPEINSLTDLAENSNYQLVTVIGSSPELQLLDPRATGLMKEVGHKLLKCPSDICRAANYDAGAKKVLENENIASFLTVTYAKNYIYKSLSGDGTCQMTMAQYRMANTNYFMACPKNSPYSFPLYTASLRYHSFGFSLFWVKQYMNEAPQCILKYNIFGECVNVAGDGVRLKLEQFYIAFGVLFGGYVLALLQFLRERLIHY